MPTSVCFFEPTATVGSSELVPESVPDVIAGSLSSFLSVVDASKLGSLTVKAIVLSPAVGAPGIRFLATIGAFFFSPTGGFFIAPGPTFLPPGTTLVPLKRKKLGTFGFPDNTGLSLNLGLGPSFLLTRGLVLAITVAEESSLRPTTPPTFTESASLPSFFLPCWSKTCFSGEGFNSWSLSPTSCPGAGVTCVVTPAMVTFVNVSPKDVKGVITVKLIVRCCFRTNQV